MIATDLSVRPSVYWLPALFIGLQILLLGKDLRCQRTCVLPLADAISVVLDPHFGLATEDCYVEYTTVKCLSSCLSVPLFVYTSIHVPIQHLPIRVAIGLSIHLILYLSYQ